jgi:hypothetical protein
MKTKLFLRLKYLVLAWVLGLTFAYQPASASTVMDFGDVTLGTSLELSFPYKLNSGYASGDGFSSPIVFYGTEQLTYGGSVSLSNPAEFALGPNPTSNPIDIIFSPSSLGPQSALLTVHGFVGEGMYIGMYHNILDIELAPFVNTFSVTGNGVVPLPGALPLFATGLAGLGLIGWRRKKAAAG